MSNEEAIWELAKQQGIITKPHLDEVVPAYDVAIEAIKKQIPQAPTYEEWNAGFSRKYFCPICGRELVDTASIPCWELQPYCCGCGQALDWETRVKEDDLLLSPEKWNIDDYI